MGFDWEVKNGRNCLMRPVVIRRVAGSREFENRRWRLNGDDGGGGRKVESWELGGVNGRRCGRKMVLNVRNASGW